MASERIIDIPHLANAGRHTTREPVRVLMHVLLKLEHYKKMSNMSRRVLETPSLGIRFEEAGDVTTTKTKNYL